MSDPAARELAEVGYRAFAGAIADRAATTEAKERSMSQQKPSVGRIVHYVSHGTPIRQDGTQAFPSVCRAAIVTAVHDDQPVPAHGVPYVDLAVFNPEGMFFNKAVLYDEGAATPGDPACPNPHENGPHRYCACGWVEPGLRGGTWHWPERV